MIRNKEMHLPMWRRFWLGIGATLTSLIVGLGASQVCADPTHANPNAHFKIHGVIDESTGLYETATAAFDQLVELSDKLEAGKAQPRELGAGQLAFIRLERSANRLMIYGEPAGAEMHMSWQAFATTVNTALQQFRGTPQGQKVTAELLRRLQSKAAVANRTKNVQQITKLIEANKFPEAEKALDAALDEIRADSAYLSESDRDAIYDIYKQVTGVVENRMRELRTRKAMQVRDEVAKAYFQKRDQLFAAADQALAELPRGGTAKFGEQTLNGPALVAEFAKQWGVVHLALMKAAAIDYAAPSGEGYAGRGNESLRGKWQQQAAELTQGALKRLAALVEAEAGAAPPNIAKARYVEYVQIFGTIAPRMSSPQALQPLEPVLKKLAERGGLLSAVDGYQKSTSEMLRWRERVAAKLVEAQEKEFPRLVPEFQAAAKAGERESGLRFTGGLPQLVAPLRKSMPTLSQQVLKRKVSADAVVRFGGQTAVPVVRYDRGVFARLPTTMAIENSLPSLQQDLMADAKRPPLTITAAAALWTAERGEYVAVGGEIAGLELCGSIARFANLPEAAAPLVPWDDVQPPVVEGNELLGIAAQALMNPTWVSHRYFFAKVKAP